MITITVEESADLIGAAVRNKDDLRPVLEMGLSAWRALGREEFEQGAWRPQSGAMRPWAPTRSGRTPPLGGASSSILWPYLGDTFYTIVEFTDNSVTFGSAHPAAAVHRGEGSVTVADAAKPHRQKMSRRQRAYLAIKFKESGLDPAPRAKDDPDRGFIVTPRRPHFTTSPELRTRITAIFSAYVRGVEVPPELLTEGGLR